MKKDKSKTPTSWWAFTGEDEVFRAESPDRFSHLYFPLCNEAGLMSCITPQLHGQITLGQHQFLTLPLSTEDLHNTRSGRNFWVGVDGREPWSAVGASAQSQADRFRTPESEKSHIEVGQLWHKLVRENKHVGLRSEIINFVPVTQDTLEIMCVTLTNVTRKPLRLTPTAAIPIFGRSADNVRDHRHVSSLLHRIYPSPHGVLVQPTMTFNERGHHENHWVYAVLGAEESGEPPIGSFPTVESFIGEGGSFDAPKAVYEEWDIPELSPVQLQGREAVGALRFKTRKLLPEKSVSYIVLMGVATDRKMAEGWVRSYATLDKVQRALTENKQVWKTQMDRIQFHSEDAAFDRWLKWVMLQPVLRKIFGNSFLPDHDYGHGGRGWRDLWQDSLALLLFDPGSVRDPLLNHFSGIRMNGTNATIIGKQPGEFIADRNAISRVWMDHGVWPWLTLELYLHATADWEILFQEVSYFWDQDAPSTPGAGPKGTVLEHLLVQHLTTYFNVGFHGNCRLEDGDWNDGLDMAREKGESVAFTAMYAGNLLHLAEALKKLAEQPTPKDLQLAEELGALLESSASSLGQDPAAKRNRLKDYRARCKAGITGRKIKVSLNDLIEDLTKKSAALSEHVQTQEWISSSSAIGWFNGYYDNTGERLERDTAQGVRMTLTGQVFPILSGVATKDQVAQSFGAAKKHLQDKKSGGFRLNTDISSAPPLGRLFGFAYGEKENGAFFNHMVVMFAFGLYQRGFVAEGYEVISSLYRMSNAEAAKIYPGIPEYFNGEGRGMYHFLTGSGSWFLLTFVNQVLGIRGQWGDLLMAPKLMPEQWGRSGQIMAQVPFAGKELNVTYLNRGKKPYGKYRIESVLLQGRSLPISSNTSGEIIIPRKTLLEFSNPKVDITIALA